MVKSNWNDGCRSYMYRGPPVNRKLHSVMLLRSGFLKWFKFKVVKDFCMVFQGSPKNFVGSSHLTTTLTWPRSCVNPKKLPDDKGQNRRRSEDGPYPHRNHSPECNSAPRDLVWAVGPSVPESAGTPKRNTTAVDRQRCHVEGTGLLLWAGDPTWVGHLLSLATPRVGRPWDQVALTKNTFVTCDPAHTQAITPIIRLREADTNLAAVMTVMDTDVPIRKDVHTIDLLKSSSGERVIGRGALTDIDDTRVDDEPFELLPEKCPKKPILDSTIWLFYLNQYRSYFEYLCYYVLLLLRDDFTFFFSHVTQSWL